MAYGFVVLGLGLAWICIGDSRASGLDKRCVVLSVLAILYLLVFPHVLRVCKVLIFIKFCLFTLKNCGFMRF